MSTPRHWLARATGQFARTVYSELRRAGHDNADVLRFVNEVLGLIGQSSQSAHAIEPPSCWDPERGLLDPSTAMEIVDFEIRRAQSDRRGDHLAVMLVDLVLPEWRAASSRESTHAAFARIVMAEMRATDSFAHLAGDRYLLVLPGSKAGVREAVNRRLCGNVEREAELSGLYVDVRWAQATATDTSARLVETLIASEPVRLPRQGPLAAPPRVEPGHSRPQVLLALGGGAARAASHAGVIEALAERGLEVAGIAGCSAGALVGAMVARGMKSSAIAQRFADFAGTPVYSAIRNAYARFVRDERPEGRRLRTRYFGASAQAFYSEKVLCGVPDELLVDFVEHFVGADCNMAQLALPFSVVATDLVEGRPVILAHGSLHSALAATCAVPGLFAPQVLGERMLVDGSVVVEVPVWAAQLLGVDAPVVAVHMSRPYVRIDDYQTSAEVSARCNALVHAELAREQLRHTKLLISVPVQDVAWLDFRRAHEVVELGRKAAREALAQLPLA